jgi:hypothetical protein
LVGVAGVVVVCGVVGVVGVDGVVVVVVVGVVSVVVAGGVVSVSVVGVVSVCVAVCAGRHSRRASWATVEAPWLRLFRNVAFTEVGRLATALESSLVALDTPLQLPDDSSEDTWSSWLLSVFA